MRVSQKWQNGKWQNGKACPAQRGGWIEPNIGLFSGNKLLFGINFAHLLVAHLPFETPPLLLAGAGTFKKIDMETPVNLIESLVEKAEDYGRTTFELSKLKTLETVTGVVTSLVARVCIILAISLFLLVLTIGIALLLGDLLGKSYYGFFIVAAFYLFAGIVLKVFLRKWIKTPLSDLIIRKALQ